MEFFTEARVQMSAADIQRHVAIANLNQWCASIDKVLKSDGEKGEIYCVWGQFRIDRELIRNGVRFTLPSCLNGIQWTVTAERPGQVQVHCTINRREQEPEFVETLEAFVADWQAGLEGWPVRRAGQRPKGCVSCGDSYGGFG